MRSRYRVALNGTHLDTLDNNLLILDVAYSQIQKQVRQTASANLDGFDISSVYTEKQIITVSFELHIYDTAKRNKACQTVNKWASGGGTLTINDREGQQISVVCEQTAVIESVRDWTAPLTLVFSTSSKPYWESVTEKVTTITGKSASGNLVMDGNTGSALVSVEVTAKAPVSSLQITVGDTVLKLTGFSLQTNQVLTVDYVNGRYLRVRANGSSIMNRLNPDSSDNLKAPCGTRTRVAITANNSVNAVFRARGLWL